MYAEVRWDKFSGVHVTGFYINVRSMRLKDGRRQFDRKLVHSFLLKQV
jgi:hypothetical protein